MLINDLEDQIGLRVNLDVTDEYVLQRVEFTLDKNCVSFQDFKDYHDTEIDIDKKI